MIHELDPETRGALFCFLVIAGLVAFAHLVPVDKRDEPTRLRLEIEQGKKDLMAYRALQRVQDDIWCVEAAKAGR